VEEVTRVGKVPGGAWVGLLPFLGTGVCGWGGGFGGGGEAQWVVWWCAPRPGCGLEREKRCFERERRVVLREQRSLGLNSLVVDRKRQINNTINGSCFQKARERESEGAEESRPGLARCRSQKTDQTTRGMENKNVSSDCRFVIVI